MTKPSITVEGDERLNATARHAADELEDMHSTNQRVSEVVRARAASNAPKETGHLAGSVVVSAVGPLDVEVAATADYANVIEFGHQTVPARPFMADALRDTQTVVVAAYAQQVEHITNNVKGA